MLYWIGLYWTSVASIVSPSCISHYVHPFNTGGQYEHDVKNGHVTATPFSNHAHTCVVPYTRQVWAISGSHAVWVVARLGYAAYESNGYNTQNYLIKL